MVESPRPLAIEDKRAQGLMDRWYGLRDTVSGEAKDKIGALYIEHILGLGEEKAAQFVDGINNGTLVSELWHEVGMAQSGFKPPEESVDKFWTSANELEPRLLSERGDFEFTKEHDDGAGASHLLWSLEPGIGPPGGGSFVLHELRVNAHSYK